MFRVVIYATAMSPFCSVLDTYLRFERLYSSPQFKFVQVEPWKKAQLAHLDIPRRVTPIAEIQRNEEQVEIVVKAEEIIDRVQALRGLNSSLPPFTNAQKNTCMKINMTVLPIVALNRHLSLAASRETVRYMSAYASQWGPVRTWITQTMVPVFYWRIWRFKMASAVLKEVGGDVPQIALVDVLEKWQDTRGNR
jgi:hypothetical protein